MMTLQQSPNSLRLNLYFMNPPKDAGPMAMATMAWASRQQPTPPDDEDARFEEWHTSLDSAFEAYAQRMAS